MLTLAYVLRVVTVLSTIADLLVHTYLEKEIHSEG